MYYLKGKIKFEQVHFQTMESLRKLPFIIDDRDVSTESIKTTQLYLVFDALLNYVVNGLTQFSWFLIEWNLFLQVHRCHLKWKEKSYYSTFFS